MINFLDDYGFKMPEIPGVPIPGPTNPVPPAITDGNTVAWYDSTDLTTITMVANRVSLWADRLLSGRDLAQIAAPAQPLWSANGILFDGAADFMKTAPFAYNQPEMIYMVVRNVTWTFNDYMFDGNILNAGTVALTVGVAPQLLAYAGIVTVTNANLAVNTWGIMRVLFNGAASTFQIDETVPIAANFGANNMGGFTLGARGDGLASESNIEVREVILRNIADTAANQAAIYNYLETKYEL